MAPSEVQAQSGSEVPVSGGSSEGLNSLKTPVRQVSFDDAMKPFAVAGSMMALTIGGLVAYGVGNAIIGSWREKRAQRNLENNRVHETVGP
jgi:uncharacterized protein (DUF2062 family)